MFELVRDPTYRGGVDERADGTLEAWRVEEDYLLGAIVTEDRLALRPDGTVHATRTRLRHHDGLRDVPQEATLRDVVLALDGFGSRGGRAKAGNEAVAAARPVLDRLDPDGLSTLHALGYLDERAWNAVVVRPDRAAFNERLREWPFLGAWAGRDASLDDAVVSGSPDAICARFRAAAIAHVTPPLLRRLRGVVPNVRDHDRFLRMVGDLPVGLLPSCADDWARAFALCDAAGDLPDDVVLTRKGSTLAADFAGVEGLLYADRILKGRKGKVEPLAESLFGDVAAAFAEDVVAPALCLAVPGAEADAFDPGTPLGRAVRERAAEVLVGGRTVRDAYRVSERWHRTFGEVDAAVPDSVGLAEVTWAVPCGTFRTADGAFEVVPLADALALRHEGRVMWHCVGSKKYVRECVRGDAVILSVRAAKRGSGAPLATLELAPSTSSGHRRVQFRGKGNADAPEEAATVLREWERAVRSGDLPFAMPKRSDVRPVLSYDWTDGANVAAATAAWKDLLPATYRAAEPPAMAGAALVAMARFGLDAAPDFEAADPVSVGP